VAVSRIKFAHKTAGKAASVALSPENCTLEVVRNKRPEHGGGLPKYLHV
jgi:hypothetical protein